MSRKRRSERGAIRLDPRLVIGIVLVVASTTGVWALVSGLDRSTPVFAVRETVVAGSRITADDLERVAMRADGEARRYLAPADLAKGGVIATRTIGAGELLPKSAVSDRESAGLARIVVQTRGPLPTGAGVGTPVDVWTAKAVEHGRFEAPGVLVPGAVISAVGDAQRGMMATAAQPSVEVLVPREKVAPMLQALAAGDAIDLVPARASRG